MPICNRCFIDKEENDFYKVKNNGVISRRKICKICHTKRELDRYNRKVGKIDNIDKRKIRVAFCTTCNEWKDKHQSFAFDITKCNVCIKNELETILDTQNEIVEEDTIEEQSPEFTPLELEDEPLYRTCSTCGMEKLRNEYYKSNKRNCISCLLTKRKKLSIAQNDGTQWAVLRGVGEYQCEEQFDALSDMMYKLGWKYEPNGTNDYNGMWYKPGFKDEFGNFLNITSNTKPKRTRRFSSKTGVSKLDGRYEEIKLLREQGHIYMDIAEMLGCSHTTLRHFVKKHKLLNKS